MFIIKNNYSIDRTTADEIIAQERLLEDRKREQERMQMGRAI